MAPRATKPPSSLLPLWATFLLAAGMIAEGQELAVDGFVAAGSRGNRVSFHVVNPSSSLEADDLKLSVVSAPAWLTVAAIESNDGGPLGPAETRRFALVFDVSESAQAGSVGVLEVAFDAADAFFDQPSLAFRLAVAERNLQLLSIVIDQNPKVEWSPGQPGFVERGSSPDGDVRAFCFDSLPLELVPGEPIRFDARWTLRKAYPDGHPCRDRASYQSSAPGFDLQLQSQVLSARLGDDLTSYCDEGLVEEAGSQSKEATDRQGSVAVSVELNPSGEPGAYTARAKVDGQVRQDEVSGTRVDLSGSTPRLLLAGPQGLTMRYGLPGADQPALTTLGTCPSAPELSAPLRGGGPLRYKYGYWVLRVSGSGYDPYSGGPVVEKSGSSGQVERLQREPGAGPGAAEALRAELSSCRPNWSMTASADSPPYLWKSLSVTADGPYDTAEQARAASPGRGFSGREIELDPEEVKAAFGCGGQGQPGRPQTADLDDPRLRPPPPIDPSDPAGLDADRQPRVASLISQWLSAAQPPDNAVPGNQYRYDEHGRMVGGGAGGRIIGSPAGVDYGSGQSSQAKVWSSLRTKLDSIDHCTLEEYVVARLQDQSTAHCQGRYGAIRDLRGVALATARAEASQAGFQIEIVAGSPAPTPQQEGAVERQDPGPTQILKKGQGVKLVVYAPHAPAAATLPDLRGLALGEAKQRLQQLGLGVSLAAGNPAPSPDRAGKIESQEPDAGASVPAGTKVTLRVHSGFLDAREVPGVVGLSAAQARQRLEAADLAVRLVAGSPAPSEDRSGIAQDQTPAAGSQVAAGTVINLRVHSPYVPRPADDRAGGRPREFQRFDCTRTGHQAWAPHREAHATRRWHEDTYTTGCQLARSPRVNNTALYDSLVMMNWLDSPASQHWLCTSKEHVNDRWSDNYYNFFSGTRAANVSVRMDKRYPVSMEDMRPIAESYLRQIEPYAISCSALEAPVPRPAPTPRPAGRGPSVEDICPCVDEQGRRYSAALGADCGAEYFGRNYDCSVPE